MSSLIAFRKVACAATLTATVVSLWAWPGLGPGPAAQTATAEKRAAKTASSATTTAKGEQGIVVLVNDEPITAYAVEQRARFLALNANVGEQAKENFQRLVKSESTKERFRELQEEVLRTHKGKTREQMLAIFQERQKQLGMALQKQALDSARSVLLPRLRKEAKEELIDERLKVQAAKKHGIEVTDDEVNGIIKGLADRNKMTTDEFKQHLTGMGVDIATLGDRFRKKPGAIS